MQGLGKELFPSKSTAVPKFSSAGFEDNNENESSQDNIIRTSQNYKKIVTKHFMAPGSASSKAAAPINKILVERSENSRSFHCQNHKISNIGRKHSPRNYTGRFTAGIVSLYDNASELEDDGGTNSLDSSSVKAYDPLKNYLSPRPKYLRFNPNRRFEILKRLEIEGIEKLKNSVESDYVDDEDESSAEEIEGPFSPSKESVVELENRQKIEEDDDAIDDNEDEEEEVEEERGWCLRGVLKLLLTLIACFFSTSYICSMKPSTPSQTQQAMWNLRDGCFMVKKYALGFVDMKMHENGFFEDKYSEVENVVIDEDNNGGTRESFDAENVEDGVENLERNEMELVRNECEEESTDEVDKATEFESAAELEFEVENFEQSVAADSDETMDTMESSYMDFNEENLCNKEGAITEIVDGEIKSFGPKSDVSEDTDEYNTEGARTEIVDGEIESIGSTHDVSEDTDEYVTAMEIEGSSKFQNIDLSLEPISKETQNESKKEKVDEELTDSANEDETEKVTWNTLAVIIVFTVCLISTSLAVIYHQKRARNAQSEESNPIRRPHKFLIEEKVTPLVPCIERKVEFLARPPPSSSHPSMDEAPQETNRHVNAPSIELIGEIVFGKLSNNLRISEKSQMAETEAINAATFSGSLSPSDGSFTTERNKIFKKEGVHRGGAMAEVTPVRRSNRLRNRAAVTSP